MAHWYLLSGLCLHIQQYETGVDVIPVSIVK